MHRKLQIAALILNKIARQNDLLSCDGLTLKGPITAKLSAVFDEIALFQALLILR